MGEVLNVELRLRDSLTAPMGKSAQVVKQLRGELEVLGKSASGTAAPLSRLEEGIKSASLSSVGHLGKMTGGLIRAEGAILSLSGVASAGFGEMGQVIGGASLAIVGLGRAFSTGLGPIGLAVTLITTLVAQLASLIGKAEEAEKMTFRISTERGSAFDLGQKRAAMGLTEGEELQRSILKARERAGTMQERFTFFSENPSRLGGLSPSNPNLSSAEQAMAAGARRVKLQEMGADVAEADAQIRKLQSDLANLEATEKFDAAMKQLGMDSAESAKLLELGLITPLEDLKQKAAAAEKEAHLLNDEIDYLQNHGGDATKIGQLNAGLDVAREKWMRARDAVRSYEEAQRHASENMAVGFNRALDTMLKSGYDFEKEFLDAFHNIQNSFSGAIQGMILQGKSFKDAMQGVARAILASFVKMGADLVAANVMRGILGSAAGGAGAAGAAAGAGGTGALAGGGAGAGIGAFASVALPVAIAAAAFYGAHTLMRGHRSNSGGYTQADVRAIGTSFGMLSPTLSGLRTPDGSPATTGQVGGFGAAAGIVGAQRAALAATGAAAGSPDAIAAARAGGTLTPAELAEAQRVRDLVTYAQVRSNFPSAMAQHRALQEAYALANRTPGYRPGTGGFGGAALNVAIQRMQEADAAMIAAPAAAMVTGDSPFSMTALAALQLGPMAGGLLVPQEMERISGILSGGITEPEAAQLFGTPGDALKVAAAGAGVGAKVDVNAPITVYATVSSDVDIDALARRLGIQVSETITSGMARTG